MKMFLYRLVCGMVIGIGCVLPGVSGGIMAVSMGLYEGMMSAVGNFFSGVKKNIAFLLPLAIGGGIGILLTSNVLSIVIERYEAPMLALFVGLVLGSLPELFVEVKASCPRISLRHVIAAVCGLAFVLLFALGESSVAVNEKAGSLTIVTALISGAVLSVGTVLPGVSSSFILIYLGLYNAVLSVLAGIFDLTALVSSGIAGVIQKLGTILVPLLLMALGFAVVSLVIIKGVNQAIKSHRAVAYSAIVGFVVGSVVLIIPRVFAGVSWVCAPAFLLGLAVSLLQCRAKLRREKKAERLPEQKQIQHSDSVGSEQAEHGCD